MKPRGAGPRRSGRYQHPEGHRRFLTPFECKITIAEVRRVSVQNSLWKRLEIVGELPGLAWTRFEGRWNQIPFCSAYA